MKFYLGLIAVFLTTNINAEPISNILDTKKLCQSAAAEFGRGDFKKSFNLLKPNWALPDTELNNIIYQTQTSFSMISPSYGKQVSSDFIKTEVISSSFVKHTFVEKYENNAVRYMCIFYKAQNEWKVNNISWDDKISLLFR